MATTVQVTAILDDVLRVPAGVTSMAAKFLRAGGLLPSTQGVPTQLTSEEVGRLMLAVVLGSPCSADSPAVVQSYTDMRPLSGGQTFGDTLAGFIDNPNDLLDLRIDASAPGATVTFRGEGNGVQTMTFIGAEPSQRPAFAREIAVGPEVFVRLAAAIRNAPEVRAGRRRLAERYETRSRY